MGVGGKQEARRQVHSEVLTGHPIGEIQKSIRPTDLGLRGVVWAEM